MTDQKRRIVVIGREGQVARSLIAAFGRVPMEVHVVARPEIDLANKDLLHRAIVAKRPHAVVNAAAYTAVDRAEDERDLAFAINASGAEAAAKAAAACQAPIIHFSTDYVYGGDKQEPYVETDRTAPLGVYGASKLEGEHRVQQANARHVILRTAWVCSPYGNNFVKTMLRLAAARPELNVVDDQSGNPTFAGDLAGLVTQIVPRLVSNDASDEHYGIFHAVNSGSATWCEFARSIMAGAALRGAPHVPVRAITTAEYPTKARRPVSSKLSTAKLERVYAIRMGAWQPALSHCLDELISPRMATGDHLSPISTMDKHS